MLDSTLCSLLVRCFTVHSPINVSDISIIVFATCKHTNFIRVPHYKNQRSKLTPLGYLDKQVQFYVQVIKYLNKKNG